MTGILASGTPARLDALRSSGLSAALQVGTILGFALLTAAGAHVRIYLWEIPITLQTVFVYGSGLVLGTRNGTLAMLLYLALGLVLPVFAGGGYGPVYLLTAVSAGYLVGMPLASMVTGLLSRRWNSLSGSVFSVVAGSVALFTVGVIWFHFAAGHETWLESIEKGWLRFVLFDAAKILGVGLLYTGARRVL